MRCLVGACRLEERARGGGNGWCIESIGFRSRMLEGSTTNRRVTQTKEIEEPQEKEKEDDKKVEDER